MAAASNGKEFLPPDEAFVLSAEAEDGNTIVADWQIADGYYLYRSKMRFAIADPQDVAVGEPLLPDGKTKVDEYFGEMEVYYQQVQATLPLQRVTTQPQNVTLEELRIESYYPLDEATERACREAG